MLVMTEMDVIIAFALLKSKKKNAGKIKFVHFGLK